MKYKRFIIQKITKILKKRISHQTAFRSRADYSKSIKYYVDER